MPKNNGFVEHFNRIVKDEFFAVTFREKFYAILDELQADLNQWLSPAKSALDGD